MSAEWFCDFFGRLFFIFYLVLLFVLIWYGQKLKQPYISTSLIEDNARGKPNSNINSPLDCRGDGNTILVGAPKTTQQFYFIA